MTLARLTVRNFRNLAALDLAVPARGAVIIGENGQGKTNLLEAIYYLVLFRSFRGATDRELVRFGEHGFFLAATAEGAGDARVTAGYDAPTRKKKVTRDGVEVPRLADAVGTIVAVVLSPADRALVAGAPAERRRYLDVLLALSEPGYLDRLSAYRAALRQRNAALRAGRGEAAWAFDEPLAASGSRIVSARAAWVAGHAERFGALSAALGERGQAQISYRGAPGNDVLAADLRAARERDLRRGTTTVGPHRDDLRLVLDGRETRHFGSAGQQRTAAIALRLLEAETLRAHRGASPLALFDDVFAELDEDRQARLLALIRETLPGQAIVTAPRDQEVPAALFDRPRWQMREGRIAT